MTERDSAHASLATQYLREFEGMLARHAARQRDIARLPATSYLRAALGCVRELAALSRFDPRLVTAAQEVLGRLTTATREAEERCFAAGGNSAPYLSLLVQIETWRIRLMIVQVRHEQSAGKPAPPIMPASPATPPAHAATPPLPTVAARRYVPATQGGRHR